MEIRFTEELFPESVPLKMRLELFFNRPDVQETLEQAAQFVFHDLNKRRDGYPFGPSCGLLEFDARDGRKSDSDPYNMCSMVFDVAKAVAKDDAASQVLKSKMAALASQAVNIADTQATDCELKDMIAYAANKAEIKEGRAK